MDVTKHVSELIAAAVQEAMAQDPTPYNDVVTTEFHVKIDVYSATVSVDVVRDTSVLFTYRGQR